MNEKEFNLIKTRLDEINNFDNILEKNIFVNWFFITKPHPFYLKNYEFFKKRENIFIFIIDKELFKINCLFFNQ